jgi:hypothetical protein
MIKCAHDKPWCTPASDSGYESSAIQIWYNCSGSCLPLAMQEEDKGVAFLFRLAIVSNNVSVLVRPMAPASGR